jgi:hypothetical protein
MFFSHGLVISFWVTLNVYVLTRLTRIVQVDHSDMHAQGIGNSTSAHFMAVPVDVFTDLFGSRCYTLLLRWSHSMVPLSIVVVLAVAPVGVSFH